MRYDNRNCILAPPLIIPMSNRLFKELSLTDCQLHPGRIDIWQFPLDRLPDWARTLLQEDEKQRADRFYFPIHQRRFTIARAVLRLILASYLGSNPTELRFSYNNYGKPQLINNHQLEFNLSHSRDLALLAIGQKTAMGIDLEYFSARPYQGIAETMFSSSEYQALSAQPDFLKPLSFFNIWAQKEAFIKACGLGLSYPTQQFDVPVLPEQPTIIIDNMHQQSWRIASFMPQAACCAALCYHPDIKELNRLSMTNLDDLPRAQL